MSERVKEVIPEAVVRVLGDDAVRCEDCAGWHHRDYHSDKPFVWGRWLCVRLAVKDIRRDVRRLIRGAIHGY